MPGAKAYRRLAWGAAFCTTYGFAAPVLAQDTQQKGPVTEEIVVTAQRRQQNLQDVPIAVSTVSASELDKRDIRSLQDMTGAVPGLVSTNSVGGGLAPLSIRGVGGVNGGANVFSDEPVAIYSDDVYIGRPTSFSTNDMLDIASIQVLRGPQGTLFGRNATAGAILITTNAPTRNFEGRLTAGLNSLDEQKLSGVLSGPVAGEWLTARLAAGWSDRRGYTRNLANGKWLNGSENFNLRGRLRAQPSPDLKIDLIGSYDRQTSTYNGFQIANLSGAATNPFNVRPDLTQIIESGNYRLDSPISGKLNAYAGTLLVEYDLSGVTLNSITAFRKSKTLNEQDADGTSARLLENSSTIVNRQFTQEIRLSSHKREAFVWTLGGFFIHEFNQIDPVEVRNYAALFGLGLRNQFFSKQTVDSWSVFGDATLALTDQIKLTGGLRYTYEKKDFQTRTTTTILNGGTIPVNPALGPLSGLTLPRGAGFPAGTSGTVNFADDVSFKRFTPRAILEWSPTDDILTYLSYSIGFKSGGFNAFGLTPAFRPEKIDAFEAGLKTELFDRRLRFNFAAFHYKYKNLQVRIGVPTGGVDIQNAASAKIDGGEIETQINPFGRLRLTANIAYLNAKFDSGTLPAVPLTVYLPYGAPITLVPSAISGNRMSRAPQWQTFLAAEYPIELGHFATMTLRADWRRQSSINFLEVNQSSNAFRGSGFDNVGASATVALADGRFEITGFVRNLTDKRYVTQVTQYASYPVGVLSEPRKWGLEFKANF